MLISYHVENYDEVICNQMASTIKLINIKFYLKTEKNT